MVHSLFILFSDEYIYAYALCISFAFRAEWNTETIHLPSAKQHVLKGSTISTSDTKYTIWKYAKRLCECESMVHGVRCLESRKQNFLVLMVTNGRHIKFMSQHRFSFHIAIMMHKFHGIVQKRMWITTLFAHLPFTLTFYLKKYVRRYSTKCLKYGSWRTPFTIHW